MKLRMIVIFMATMLAACLIVAPAISAPKPIELRFSHFAPPKARTTVRFLNPWAKKVEEATNGRVKVTMYPAQSLSKMTQAMEATTGGVADIAWLVAGFYKGRFPLSSVMALPFMNLLSGKVAGRTLNSGAINSRILQELYETFPEIQAEYAGVKVLFLHTSDQSYLFTTKKPVRNMADLKGKKIRALGGPDTRMWKALGASPMTMPLPAVYEAARRGVIDGMSIAWAAIAGWKFYEVYNYWTDAGTCMTVFGVIMNLDRWNSLPADIQKAIMSVSGVNGAEFAGGVAWGPEIRGETMARMKKAGQNMEKVDLAPGELERWKKIASKPLWDEWVKEVEAKGLPGQKVLNETLRLIEKYK